DIGKSCRQAKATDPDPRGPGAGEEPVSVHREVEHLAAPRVEPGAEDEISAKRCSGESREASEIGCTAAYRALDQAGIEGNAKAAFDRAVRCGYPEARQHQLQILFLLGRERKSPVKAVSAIGAVEYYLRPGEVSGLSGKAQPVDPGAGG